MSDPIVSSLMKKHKQILFESTFPINEAEEDADEEYLDLNKDDEEEEHDDSQAPIQGNPDDYDEEPEDSGESEEENPSEDESSTESPSVPSGGGSHAPMQAPGDAPEGGEEVPEEELDPEEMTAKPEEYENPLDNQYAVHFTLGDEVNLTATGTQNSDIKKGTIEGYDPEGFYKVKWSDDSYTNGLTDIALEELVATKNESVCICGSAEFITEGKYIVCDCCGRKLRESTLDPLTLADKSRPKGKRMIRSEAHPVSTASKPNIDIAEAIRKAFKGTSINEEEDPEIEEDHTSFDKLKDELSNEFSTRQEEMKEDIEELGYTVEEMNNEYIIVSSEEEYEDVWKIPVEGTSRSFYLNFDKYKLL